MGTLAIWLAVPLALTIVLFILNVIMPGYGGLHQSYWLSMHSTGSPDGAAFWVWAILCSVATLALAIYVGFWYDAGYGYYKRTPDTPHYHTPGWPLVLIALALLGISIYQCVQLGWNDDKNVARYYDTNTTFYTPSLSNYPPALDALMKGATKGTNGCALVGTSDVPSCIKQGSLPLSGFQPRVSSLAGAQAVMQRTSGTTQNVDLLTDTLTYLNGAGKDGVWSGIRDGQGSFQPTEGVVEWAGVGNPTECEFKGSDSFNKAINGTKKNSLVNYIKVAYPALYWTEGDEWGYCNSKNQPVLVFPVYTQIHHLSAAVSAPAGVLVVTGSASGTPTLTYDTHAANLPGPVYPSSLAAAQRVNANWAAGRGNWQRGLFGFEPSNSLAQSGNTSEYLLKSNADHHLYWVTPLTLTSSQSQLFVAYSMVRADTVTAGHLNQFSVYVLNPTDKRVVNIDNLEASAREYVSQQNPGFFSSGGSLIEYTPTSGDVWRAFGEINGRVVYRLDISAGNFIVPRLVSLENYNGTGTRTKTGTSYAYCGQPPATLSQAQIVACVKELTNSLT